MNNLNGPASSRANVAQKNPQKSENRVETCLPTSRMVENIFVRCEETQNKGNSSWMELAVGLNFFLSLDRARL